MPITDGYEPETVRVFNQVLTAGDQVIVCGAHQGYFVGICSHLVGPAGRVFGFEPEPGNFAKLIEATGKLENVELFNHALGNQKATAPFFVNSDNDGGHALWDVSRNPLNVKSQENRIVIKTEVNTIDNLFAERDMSRLKLLMFDAEGAEHAILKGGINTIVDNEVPYIICEINQPALLQCGTSQMELRNYLSMYGYTGYWADVEKCVDIGRDDWMVKVGEEFVVFNILFSRRGKI
jgi:FkbM family methyltransferase